MNDLVNKNADDEKSEKETQNVSRINEKMALRKGKKKKKKVAFSVYMVSVV